MRLDRRARARPGRPQVRSAEGRARGRRRVRARRARGRGRAGDRLRPGRRRAVRALAREHGPARSHAARAPDRLGRRRARRSTSSGIAPVELVRLARARPVDVVEDRPYDFHDRRETPASRPTRRSANSMQETEKIWMNGELVDWADAKVHVGVHGLHYGTGVFEGIRCYDTAKGPAIFRLREHLERLDALGADPLHGDAVLDRRASRGDARARRDQRSRVVLHPSDRVLRLQRARRRCDRQPDRRRDHELAVGRVPRRGQPGAGHHGDDLELGARRARTSSRTPRRRRASTSTRCSRRRKPAEPATTRRSCSRPRGHIADGPGETIFVVRDGVISTPHLGHVDPPGHHAPLGDRDRA